MMSSYDPRSTQTIHWSELDSGFDPKTAASDATGNTKLEVKDLIIYVHENKFKLEEVLLGKQLDYTKIPRGDGVKNYIVHHEKNEHAFDESLRHLGLPPLYALIVDVATCILQRFSQHFSKRKGTKQVLLMNASMFMINEWLNEYDIVDKL